MITPWQRPSPRISLCRAAMPSLFCGTPGAAGKTPKPKARGRGEGAKRASASRVKLLDALTDITYYWTPLDQFVPYVFSAAREAARVAKEQQAQLIYAASNPPSALVAGTLAGALSGLPVVLDLRDPWSLDPLHFLPKPAGLRFAEQQLEQLCFQRARPGDPQYRAQPRCVSGAVSGDGPQVRGAPQWLR